MKLLKTYATEGLDYPEDITVFITPELSLQILHAQSLLKATPFLVNMVIRDDVLICEEWEEMQESCHVGYSGIKVYPDSWVWEVQSKYDCSVFAEYELQAAKTVYFNTTGEKP